MRRTRFQHTEKYLLLRGRDENLSKNQKFWDALHLAQPCRFGIVYDQVKERKSHFAKVQPGVKFIREEIPVLSLSQFQKKIFIQA